MSELRQNVATKEWVIIATDRAQRPRDFSRPSRKRTEDRPERQENCPFCPGNEDQSEDVMRIPEDGPWQVRTVLNKYGALQRDGMRERIFEGVRRRVSGVGYHEVIIESPRHNTCAALQSPDAVAVTLRAFQQRGKAIKRDPNTEHIIYFKNHGQRAGTSLEHPHTQLIGLPLVPHHIRNRNEEARRYFDDMGHCVHCQMWSDELEDASRIVATNEDFVALIPYAAFSPFHTWIIPRRHHPTFLSIGDDELNNLGQILHNVLRKIYVGLGDPDYNYVVRSAPFRDEEQEYLHWYVTIVPRVTRAAGFELGSGMFINTALPEESAAFLRSVSAES